MSVRRKRQAMENTQSKIAELEADFDYICLVQEETPQGSDLFWEESEKRKTAILEEIAALRGERHDAS